MKSHIGKIKLLFSHLKGREVNVVINGQSFLCNCPSPDHEDKNPSCIGDLRTGQYKCLGCGEGGTIDFDNEVAVTSAAQFEDVADVMERLRDRGFISLLSGGELYVGRPGRSVVIDPVPPGWMPIYDGCGEGWVADTRPDQLGFRSQVAFLVLADTDNGPRRLLLGPL